MSSAIPDGFSQNSPEQMELVRRALLGAVRAVGDDALAVAVLVVTHEESASTDMKILTAIAGLQGTESLRGFALLRVSGGHCLEASLDRMRELGPAGVTEIER